MKTTLRIAGLLLVLSSASCAVKGADGPAGPAGPEGPAGPTGPGFSTPPTVSAVIPSRAAVSLETEVTISGFATHWTSSAQVSFGAGITVKAVKVGSATGLVATISISPSATPGPRDVTVTQGSEVSTFTGVFTVVPLVEARLLGTAARGLYWFIEVRHNDPDFSFDSTPYFTLTPNPTAGNIDIESYWGRQHEQMVVVHADLLADLGKYSLTVDSGSDSFRFADIFTLADKTEIALAENVPATGTLAEPYAGALFSYAPAAPSLTLFHASAGSGTRPQLVVMGATGADLGTSDGWGPGNDIVYNSTATTTLLTLLEASGKANVTYSVVALTGLTAAPEVEPNDTPPTAQALTLTPLGADKGVLLAGTTESSTAVDYFKVTLAAGDVGKRIHVRTGNSDYVYIDVAVADSNGKSLGSALHKSETTDLYSEPVTAAGDYVVEVRGDYTGAYNLVVSVQ